MSVVVDLDYRTELGAIRDQGARPTCLSHAATTAHEHSRRSRVPLSPEYLHYFAVRHGSSGGVHFREIVRALSDPGQPTERNCPYCAVAQPVDWRPPTGVRLFRRNSELTVATADNVEALLKAGRVPVLGMAIPQSFFCPTAPWLVSPAGPVRGLHAVVAVAIGTAQAERCFLIRNSWGADWGDGGHVWLEDSFLGEHLHYLLVLSGEVTE